MAGFVIIYRPTGSLWTPHIFPSRESALELIEQVGEVPGDVLYVSEVQVE